MKISIRIPGRLPGRNGQEAAARASHFTAAKLKKRWTGWCRLCAETELKGYNRTHDAPWDPGRCYDVACTWFEPNRRRDPDNVSAAIKFVLDGFQPSLLSNDGWKNVGGISHRFETCDGDPGVLVELEETE